MEKLLVSFLLAASLFASAGHRALPEDFAKELATQIETKPLFSGSQGTLTDAALMASLAWLEGGNIPGAVGDCPGKGPGDPSCTAATAQAWCVFQVRLLPGNKTRDGWTGPELAADPKKCITVARRILEASITSRENKAGACPLCVYARGRWTPEAQHLSDHRMSLAKKLLKEIHVEDEESDPY